MNDAYTKALKKIMTDDKVPLKTTATRVELETHIARISEELRGHLPNADRLFLIEHRQMLRKQLEHFHAPTLHIHDRKSEGQ